MGSKLQYQPSAVVRQKVLQAQRRRSPRRTREQEGNQKEIKMIISYHFSNFDPRSFPSQSGIPKDVQSHVELEF